MLFNMSFPLYEVSTDEFPPLLHEIPEPPHALNARGKLPDAKMKLIAVVGSRKYTTYAKQVVDYLISGLSTYNVGIVSGLALGVDSLAHEAALRAQLYTCAVPGSGIDDNVIYPARHKALARTILESGGGLLSEFEPTFTATKWSFAQRNRIMAGMCHATLVIEAAEKSGTLITARLATDYNRELLVVPGNIFSANSKGVHQFLKLGATPVTESADILAALNIDVQEEQKASLFAQSGALTVLEQKILTALREPADTDTLIRASGLPPHEANALLMEMEMKGFITSAHNLYYAVI